MNRTSISVLFLLVACLASSPALPAPVPALPKPDPERAANDIALTFFRECVLAENAKAVRATTTALGGRATTGAPAGTSYDFDFSGTPVTLKFAQPGLCMLEVASVDVKTVLQTFYIFQQSTSFLPKYEIVDDHGMDYDDYADDQTRPSLGDDPPSDAVVRYWVEAIKSTSTGPRNMRLTLLSNPATDSQGSMYLIRQIHAYTVQRPPLGPPQPRPGRHRIETPPSQDLDTTAMYPPRYPEAAMKSCAYGVVALIVTIDVSGTVLNIEVETSSGNAELDAAALDAARHWHFHPGTMDGQPIGGRVRVPVQFSNPCTK